MEHEERVRCPHGARCGGCAFLDVPYRQQPERKRTRLVAALAPYEGVVTAGVSRAHGAEPVVRYRTRLKWMAGPGGALGLYARGGHEVVDTPECQVAPPGLAAVADAIRALLRDARFTRVAAALRAVDLREVVTDGARRALVTLVLVREERPPRRDLVAFAEALRAARDDVAGVSANWVAKRAIQVLGPETETIVGASSAPDRHGDVDVTATPGAFVQAHRGQAAAMTSDLVGRVAALGSRGAPPRVVELFAGASPFGLALARAGCEVTSIESFAPAVQGALEAARAQGLALRAIAGDAEGEAERLVRERARVDVILVDPPRRGLSPRLRRALAALAPHAVAYVSCDPDTLARDLADLAWRGLAASVVEPWDFVPLTDHVEALAWLERATPPAIPVLARISAGPERETAIPAGARSPHRGGSGEAIVVDAPPHLELSIVAERVAAALTPPRGAAARLAPASPLPRGASGALVLTPGDPRSIELGGATALIAVRGVPRGRLDRVPGRAVLQATGPGRALVSLTLPDARDLARVLDALGRAGHPALGDPRDAATARHVLEKHGVDRPLVHVASIDAEGARFAAPLAPDLRAAITRLGLAEGAG